MANVTISPMRAKELLKQIFLFNLERFEEAQRRGTNAYDSFIIPFFVAAPGVGKTAITKQAAAECEVPYFQTIVAQFDPGELAGLPFIGQKKVVRVLDGEEREVIEDRMIRLRPTYLPDDHDPNQIIGIYNLDELPQTMLAGQNVMSQLVNEYRIGEHLVSQGITICGTGNRPEDRAGTNPMPAHLKDRLMFINIEANSEDWLRYAAHKGLDPVLRTYIRQFPDKLMKFEPKANASPTPRSWEKVSNIMQMGLDESLRYAAFSGTIGDGEAKEFETFVRIKDRLPDPDEVIRDPNAAPVFQNKDMDVLRLLLASMADKATEKNIGNIITYLRRLPNKEFAAVFNEDCFTRKPSLADTKEVRDWKMTDGAQMFFG